MLIGFFVFASPVLAHMEEGSSLVEKISKTSYSIVAIGGFLILFLTVLAVLNKDSSNVFKVTVFSSIAFIAISVTFLLAGMTVYLNVKSETGGPVHWHADFRIFACGEEMLLKEPSGLSNRIGRTDLHEHGDKRIHVEGVVVHKQDVSLHEFFGAIGGNLLYGELSFPGREKYESFADGNKCSDGREGALQVFLYKTEGKEIRQTKLADYPEYVLSGEPQVPPGDCIIFEFTPDIKDKTEKICDFTSIAIEKGQYNYVK